MYALGPHHSYEFSHRHLRNSAFRVKLRCFPLAGVSGVIAYASITTGVRNESEREGPEGGGGGRKGGGKH